MLSIDLLAYNFMSSSQISQQNIQALRSNDKVIELVNQQNCQIHPLAVKISSYIFQKQANFISLFFLSCLITQLADQLECSKKLKFFWRAFYIWLVGKSQDGVDTEQFPCYVQSSLYRAYQLNENPEDFDTFCSNQGFQEITSYLESQKHQQLMQKLNQLTNEELSFSSPYLFLQAVKHQITSQHFESTLSYLIDWALAIPMSLLCSSEEVFVACCLVLLEKGKVGGLQGLLEEHFYNSLERGHQLKAVIAQQLQQALANEV